jgi:hypothetical protein
VAQAFDLDPETDRWDAKIAGHTHLVYRAPPGPHFSEINLLGQDFYDLKEVRYWFRPEDRRVSYYIDN